MPARTVRPLLLGTLLFALSGCPSSHVPCEVGTTALCLCAGDRPGVARCLPDGEYEACFCPTDGGVDSRDGGTDPRDTGDTRDAGARDAGVRRDVGPRDAGPAPCIREVDLLFQIDTSNSMVEEQARLLSELPRLVEVLTTGDRDGDGAMDFQPITSLHLGVATPDLGGGTEPMVPTCPMGFGEDGVLRSRSGTIPPGCPAVFPSGIFQFRAGDDPAALADDFLCAAAVGTGGCGFEQQLEAVLVGLSPTVPTSWVSSSYGTPSFVGGRSPHGDRENDGFLREGSLLAITLVTDEDDCSTTDYGLFDPSNPRYAGTALNLRCNTFSDDLFPVGRYAEGYVQLREDPRLVVFSAITGIPLGSPSSDVASYDALLGSPDMQERPNADNTRLLPACTATGTDAMPARRIVGAARELERLGAHTSVGSICASSFGANIDAILEAIIEGEPSCGP